MQVRGGYHQVAQFLDRVGKLDRIVNVSNIVVKAPKVVDEDLILEANSRVTTFRFLSEAERQKLIKEKKIKGEAQ
jgi:type IV pilus assembly protein PilO